MMIYNNRLFNTRKELKRYLGGTRKYNKALKSGEIHNIYQEESNNQPFAHNGTTIYDTDKRH
ncbi:hypothetical protein DWY42_01785 [Bacteroides sp. AF25-18]|nr:hypothetical protein DWY42_01785 [Bacteroides sp. AF25-18]